MTTVRTPARLALALATAIVAGCGTKPPPPDPASPPEVAHHRGDRFQNRYVEFATNDTASYWRWKLDQALRGLPPPPASPVPAVAADRAFIDANAMAGAAMQPSVTWIGHATTLVQMGGINLLTDPIFSERASPLAFAGPRRAQPPGIAISELPRIDVVLVSHGHADHLHPASLAHVPASATVIGPPGTGPRLGKRFARLIELAGGRGVAVDGVRVDAVEVPHGAGALGPTLAFVIAGDGPRVFACADGAFVEGADAGDEDAVDLVLAGAVEDVFGAADASDMVVAGGLVADGDDIGAHFGQGQPQLGAEGVGDDGQRPAAETKAGEAVPGEFHVVSCGFGAVSEVFARPDEAAATQDRYYTRSARSSASFARSPRPALSCPESFPGRPDGAARF